MSIAGIPQQFYVQTGNGQNYLSWALTAGAVSYSVQRSTDNITYAEVATPSSNEYLDTSVTTGITYFYQIASVNTSGTSPYTAAQSVVPTMSGEMSLGQIRLNAKQRADRQNSEFLTMPEWNANINQSLFELYDLLVTAYGDYFLATPAVFQVNGTDYSYPLPNGTTSFIGPDGSSFVAEPFYKLMGVDLGLNNTTNAWVTLNKFNFIDRNKFVYPNSGSTQYGVFNMQYRVMGSNIEFIPVPSNSQNIRLWYIPRLTMLLKDSDITTASVSGWIEYVIVDAAIKALQKEESDITALMAQKMALTKRIQDAAQNRDVGQPDTISDARGNGTGWGFNGPFNGFNGGW